MFATPDDLVAGLATKRVHLLGPVDRDPGDAIAVLVQDVFEFHDGLSDEWG